MSFIQRTQAMGPAFQILPGLVHFGSKPLEVDFRASKVQWLRIHIPAFEILNINKVVLSGPRQADLDAATATMSSAFRSSGPPAEILRGRPIHTEREVHPYWHIAFKTPVEIRKIEIWNRLGLWGSRSYGVCVSLGLAGGTVLHFDNTGAEQLLLRLGEFRTRLRDLLDRLSALPREPRAAVQASIGKIEAAASALVDAAGGILRGATLPTETLQQLRADLLGAVTSLNAPLQGPVLGEVMVLSSKVVEWLLDRTPRPQGWTPSEAEMEGLATILATRFIADLRVASSVVIENDAFLADPASCKHIERRVNELYESATRNSAILPIMFRAHGMSGAELKINASKYIASMKEIAGILEEMGYPAGICYGTLLGAVRNGEFIPHDDDVDMMMLVRSTNDEDMKAELKEIVRRLNDRQITASITAGFDFLKIKAPGAGKYSDVFPIIVKDDETVRMYMEQLKIRDVPRNCVLPFSTTEFYGEQFSAPALPQEFLEQRYGSDWRIPKRAVGSMFVEA
jgi:hypothetical protein